MSELLEVSYQTRVTVGADEIAAEALTDEEFDALIEREQAEADAWARAHGTKSFKYSPDEPRDDHGRWGDGGDTPHEHAPDEKHTRKELEEHMHDAHKYSSTFITDKHGSFQRLTYKQLEDSHHAFHDLISGDDPHHLADKLEAILEGKAGRFGEEVTRLRVKYSDDEPRDSRGEWTSGADRLAQGEGDFHSADDAAPDPLAAVKFRIGTLSEDEQKTVHDTFDRLAARYPAALTEIHSVTATPLKTRWGSFSIEGKMKFTNLGSKSDAYKDPTLANTVAHEYGHALLQAMAGHWQGPKPSSRPPAGAGFTAAADYQNTVHDYNKRTQALIDNTSTLVVGMYQKIRDTLGGNSGVIFDQLTKEFPNTREYIVSSGKEEMLAEAFAHYANGQHGVIADIVGAEIDKHFKEAEA